jgi:hypothetical protein
MLSNISIRTVFTEGLVLEAVKAINTVVRSASRRIGRKARPDSIASYVSRRRLIDLSTGSALFDDGDFFARERPSGCRRQNSRDIEARPST